jgi:uncharacterized protein YlxW (UPF0749 family)
MQRQKENKKQNRRAKDASKIVRILGQGMKHVKNLAQRVSKCQRKMNHFSGRSQLQDLSTVNRRQSSSISYFAGRLCHSQA